jgi:mRNA interferase RelE/StbE
MATGGEPPRYRVVFKPSAAKSLAGISGRKTRERIAARIDALAADPRPHGSELLEGPDRFHRIRVGEYRVVCQIEDDRLVVLVVRVGHRRDVYKGL